MSLRIIGGRFRGRILKSPKGDQTRPTSAILRKAIFDICRPKIEGAHFLDLYAGSGAMGIEALSQGASHATFIDQDKMAILCIRENIRSLKLEKQSSIISGDALLILKRLKKAQKEFDIIFVDPPYHSSSSFLIKEYLDQSHLIKKEGILFFEEEFSKEKESAAPLKHLFFKDSRRYGKTLLHQYISLEG